MTQLINDGFVPRIGPEFWAKMTHEQASEQITRGNLAEQRVANWKKYFDLSPAQYINDLRLEAAAKRLKGTEIPISDIIQEVHFAGEYMFYQRFRQKFGMTPDQYRKQNKTDGLI